MRGLGLCLGTSIVPVAVDIEIGSSVYQAVDYAKMDASRTNNVGLYTTAFMLP